MSLENYDALKLEIVKAKEEVKKFKKVAQDNEKNVQVIIVEQKEAGLISDMFLGSPYKKWLSHVQPQKFEILRTDTFGLEEIQEKLVGNEISTLRHTVEELTKENQVLTTSLNSARAKVKEWRDKFENDILNQAAKKAYKELHAQKRIVANVEEHLLRFEFNPWTSKRVKNFITGLLKYVSKSKNKEE